MRVLALPAVFLCLAVTGSAAELSDRFYEAIRSDDLASLRDLAKTAGVNVKDNRGATPLMYAAAMGSSESLSLLLAAGADVNSKTSAGATALMWCAGDLEKTRLLVRKGADVRARTKHGQTALLVSASQRGASETVQFLLRHGGSISDRDDFGTTPMIAPGNVNDADTIRLLLAKGAVANEKDEFGFTPLMLAAGFGNVDLMRLLIARGADVNAVTGKDIAPPVRTAQ